MDGRMDGWTEGTLTEIYLPVFVLCELIIYQYLVFTWYMYSNTPPDLTNIYIFGGEVVN